MNDAEKVPGPRMVEVRRKGEGGNEDFFGFGALGAENLKFYVPKIPIFGSWGPSPLGPAHTPKIYPDIKG